jgi:hypothetical protein
MKLFSVHFILLICLLAITQSLHAQGVVGTLKIQGTLKQNNGQAVDDGNYALTFKLYTAPTGGTALWTETQTSVNLVGGVYSVALGTVTPLTPNFDVPYWLGVTVGTGVEMQPRMALTAAPYALSLLGSAAAHFGDIKSSYQTNDHAGWVRLDGRAKTALSATQQTRATALGIGANLPNDDGRLLAGTTSGQPAGQMSGASSTITLAQNNLPNVPLTASSAGAHTHPFTTSGTYFISASLSGSGGYNHVGAGINASSTTTLGLQGTAASAGAHTHTIALNGGVTQEPIVVPPPASIALNFFMYLGL